MVDSTARNAWQTSTNQIVGGLPLDLHRWRSRSTKKPRQPRLEHRRGIHRGGNESAKIVFLESPPSVPFVPLCRRNIHVRSLPNPRVAGGFYHAGKLFLIAISELLYRGLNRT